MAPSPTKIKVSVRHPGGEVDRQRLRAAVQAVLDGEHAGKPADIHVVVVDDETIQGLHRRFLDDDTPTDVLTFPLSEPGAKTVEGEIVISLDTAIAAAPEYGWSPLDELVLYAVHGTLHLLGYDDIDSSDRAEMRRRETTYLGKLGISRQAIQRGQAD